MDLFEYQGKQYFARYGIAVSPATSGHRRAGRRSRRANRLPVVVKAQVRSVVAARPRLKLAQDVDEVRLHAEHLGN